MINDTDKVYTDWDLSMFTAIANQTNLHYYKIFFF